jgi:hypothetical protein
MKKIFTLAACLAVCSCAWFKANVAALTADQLQLVNCITTGALAGQTVEVLAVSCGLADVSAVVSILDAAHQSVVPSPALAQVRAAKAASLNVK